MTDNTEPTTALAVESEPLLDGQSVFKGPRKIRKHLLSRWSANE